MTTLIAAFALVAQPLYGLVNMRVANAMAQPADIVINEVAPASGTGVNRWVELYNKSDDALDISGWRFVRGTGGFGTVFPAGASISGHGFYTVDATDSLPLTNGANPLELWTGTSGSGGVQVDSVDYGTVPAGQSYGRSTDGAAGFQIFSAPTKNATNGDVLSVTTAEPQLNAENFNTVDGNYKGISVGFNASNFGTVTNVTVDMTRADGSHVIKHGNQGVLDLISHKTSPVQLTAPFFIQDGTYTEAGDTQYWQPAPASWSAATEPANVTISVTDENGTKTVVNDAFSQGMPSWPAYVSLLPPDTAPPAVEFITPENNLQRNLSVNVKVTDDNLSKVSFDVKRQSDGATFSTAPESAAGQTEINLSGYDLCMHDRRHACDAGWVADGTYQIRALAYDTKGNRNITTRRNVVVDKTPSEGSLEVISTSVPYQFIVKAHVKDTGPAGLGAQQIVMRDQSGVVVGNWIYNVPTGATRIITGNGSFAYDGNEHEGTVSVTFNASDLSGAYNLRLFTKDEAGNGRSDIYGSLSVSHPVPSASFNITSSLTPNASTPILLNGTVGIENMADISTFTLNIGSLDPIDLMGSLNTSDGSWSYEKTDGLPEGTYPLTVSVTDRFGGSYTTSAITISVGSFVPNLGGRGTASLGLESRFAPSLIAPRTFAAGVTSPFTAAQNQPAKDDSAVLGAETTKEAEQASDLPAVAATENGWKFFGIAWYWWALMAAAVAGMSWWTVASLRRRKAAELAPNEL